MMTILVRLIEGNIDGGLVVHDARWLTVPRVGESFTIRAPDRSESRYRAIAVDYLCDVREAISPENDLTAVRVQVEPIS